MEKKKNMKQKNIQAGNIQEHRPNKIIADLLSTSMPQCSGKLYTYIAKNYWCELDKLPKRISEHTAFRSHVEYMAQQNHAPNAGGNRWPQESQVHQQLAVGTREKRMLVACQIVYPQIPSCCAVSNKIDLSCGSNHFNVHPEFSETWTHVFFIYIWYIQLWLVYIVGM